MANTTDIDIDDLVEDVTWLLETGESIEGIQRRTGVAWEALLGRMRRADRQDMLDALRARKRRDEALGLPIAARKRKPRASRTRAGHLTPAEVDQLVADGYVRPVEKEG